MSRIATIEIDGKKFELPIIKGTENELAIDIKKLRLLTGGITTIDSGFKNTGSCESAITFMDGEKGILRYRGYSIEDLAEKANFLEVAYLLIFGNLPDTEELEKFHEETEIPALINTSFNSHEEPIIMNEIDAIRCLELDIIDVGTNAI